MKSNCAIILFFFLALTCINSLSAQQKTVWQNQSQGYLVGYQASIDVTCTFVHHNPQDPSYDSHSCRGQIRVGGHLYTLVYEGYVSNSPYDGVLGTPSGNMRVGILSSTGGKIQIYSGKASLGPPELHGEFLAKWKRVR